MEIGNKNDRTLGELEASSLNKNIIYGIVLTILIVIFLVIVFRFTTITEQTLLDTIADKNGFDIMVDGDNVVFKSNDSDDIVYYRYNGFKKSILKHKNDEMYKQLDKEFKVQNKIKVLENIENNLNTDKNKVLGLNKFEGAKDGYKIIFSGKYRKIDRIIYKSNMTYKNMNIMIDMVTKEPINSSNYNFDFDENDIAAYEIEDTTEEVEETSEKTDEKEAVNYEYITDILLIDDGYIIGSCKSDEKSSAKMDKLIKQLATIAILHKTPII